MFEARRAATPPEITRLLASVDALLTPEQQAQLEAAQISSVRTRSELGALFTVLGVTAPKAGGPTQRTVAEVESEWATGGGTERDQDGYRRGLALAADPHYQPELLFTPSTLASSGFLLMDAIHRAAALYTLRTASGTEQLDTIAYVLPRRFEV
jgi:hypothetical protein